MKARHFAFACVVLVALLLVGSAGATTTSTLSSSATSFGTTTIYTSDGSGEYGTSTVSLDTADTNAVLLSDGYLCGSVAYHATQKWYNLFGWVLWTYRSTFGVYVCHDHVQYKTTLYDEATSSNLGWSWCGNIVRSWAMNADNLSAHSYTKGCFTVFYKIAETRYPWAKMTIGGNGNLWYRSTGVD